MLKALIIDDEPSAVNTMRLMLQHFAPQVTEVQSTTSPVEGLQLLKDFAPQLLFLDIQMLIMDGFELLTKAYPLSCSVIFTTAFDQHAIQAIRFSALDYLLKPIDAEELRSAIGRYMDMQTAITETASLHYNLLENIRLNPQEAKLALPTTEGTFFYAPEEIIRLEGEGNYTRFFFQSRKPLLLAKTLKDYEELLLQYGFIRVHKSHIINRSCIASMSADGWLVLQDGARIKVSRRRKEEVANLLRS